MAQAASGKLRVPLQDGFTVAKDGAALKARWAALGYSVLGVRPGQGHAVLEYATYSATENAA